MKQKISRVFAFLLVVVWVSYLVPTPQKTFAELYDGQDKMVVDSLREFRETPTQSLDYQGQKWQYLVTGEGSENLLFLHGMGGSYDIWWQQINAFKSDYRIVSVTYPPVSTLAEMGKAVMAILDKNNIAQVNVVGSSLGGYFTQFLLATYPNRIKKAVIGNTFPPNDVLEKQNAKAATVLKNVPEWLMMYLWRQGLYEKVIPAAQNDALTKATLLEMSYGKMSKMQYGSRYNCVVDKFQPIDYQQNKTPILIFEADNDPLVPLELREKLKQTYPIAEVHTFHGRGHFPYLNTTAEYNQVLKDFLKK